MNRRLFIFLLIACLCPLAAQGKTKDKHKDKKKEKHPMSASIVGRYICYPGSYYSDEIDTSKTPLLPGGTGAFANYIAWVPLVPPYIGKLRGIYVDVDGLAVPGAITAADFEFRYGNDDDPSGWAAATAPSVVSVTEGSGDGGSDRIKITWADSAIPNSNWLQVTVLANDNTGLAVADVHYWGLAAGETGNSADDAIVDTDDKDAVIAHLGPEPPVLITYAWDLTKDGAVNVADFSVVIINYTTAETALLLITPPLGPVPGPHHLTAGQVKRGRLATGQVTVSGLAAGRVATSRLAAGRVAVSKLVAGQALKDNLAAGSIS